MIVSPGRSGGIVAANNQQKRHGRSRAPLWSALVAAASTFAVIMAGWGSLAGIHWYQITFAGVGSILMGGPVYLERRAKHQPPQLSAKPTDAPPPWNVPSPNAQFSGRAEELARLRELFATSAVVALYGIGGVGKSQLATEYAQKHSHGAADDYELVWWMAADQPDLIELRIAELAVGLGLAAHGDDASIAAHRALGYLRRRSRWLLVYDNAKDAAALRPWLPGGGGHVLITSKNASWYELATPFELHVLRRAGSAELLRRGRGDLSDDEVDLLGDRLGDLPLAIAQATGTLAETGMPASEYLEQLEAKTAQILDEGVPSSYPRSLTATTRLSLGHLAEANPAAAHLLRVCAFLAPEPIPVRMLTEAARIIGPPALRPDGDSAVRDMVRQIVRYGLARSDRSGLQVHQLTQLIIRDQSIEQAEAISLLVRACPGDPRDPACWAHWGEYLPHLRAADLVTTSDEGLRQVVCAALWYLLCSGASEAALSLAQKVHEGWGLRYGSDDALTLHAADAAAQAYRDLGQATKACEVDENTLERRRRVLGDDHADTLAAAHNLAIDHHALGRFASARRLNEETYAARHRILGAEHPDTLASANNLAIDLYADGDPSAAIKLDETTLQLRRRILGPNHPCTFTSENNLAVALRAVGDEKRARRLHEDLVDRRRAILGNDHPHTLTSVNNLGVSLRATGDAAGARLTHERALEQRRALYGDDHHDTLTSASNLAVALYFLGEYKAARVLNEDTLKRRRRVLGEDHPDTLICAGNLAACLRATGDPDMARSLNEDTWARRRRVLGENHPLTLLAASNLAVSMHATGAHDAAQALDRETLARRRRILGDGHRDTIVSAGALCSPPPGTATRHLPFRRG
jgi:tetratricopeptide (TPR) repeat protein